MRDRRADAKSAPENHETGGSSNPAAPDRIQVGRTFGFGAGWRWGG